MWLYSLTFVMGLEARSDRWVTPIVGCTDTVISSRFKLKLLTGLETATTTKSFSMCKTAFKRTFKIGDS